MKIINCTVYIFDDGHIRIYSDKKDQEERIINLLGTPAYIDKYTDKYIFENMKVVMGLYDLDK